MSTSTRRPLGEALRDAEAFKALFDGCYERWEIAGSVRRGKPEVGDVEHVVIPRGEMLWRRVEELTRDPENIFANQEAPLTRHMYLNTTTGKRSPRWGDKYRGVDFRGFCHEIFTADLVNWGSQLVIRTGPAEFSEMMVTKMKFGGRCRQQGGYVVNADGSIRSASTEEEFFKACGVNYCEPHERKS